MNEAQTQQSDDGSEKVEQYFPQFVISQEQAVRLGRSLPLMIVGRMSYTDKQTFGENLEPDADIQALIGHVATNSSNDPDYLLPDTPLKEAIFRVMLANGNEAMTAENISELLAERWAMTAYPRDVSPEVIQRLLESSYSYGIVRVAVPEDEEDEEIIVDVVYQAASNKVEETDGDEDDPEEGAAAADEADTESEADATDESDEEASEE